MNIYLDHNATTGVDPRVMMKMVPFFGHQFGNADSRDHEFGWTAADAVETARIHVASLVGAEATEIIFTSGATESINWGLRGINYESNRNVVVTTGGEHSAVLGACEYLAKRFKIAVEYLPLLRTGRLDFESVRLRCRRQDIAVLSVMLANNEIGSIQDVCELSRQVHEAGGILFSDMTQAVGKIPVDVKSLNIDIGAFSAHKLYGPKGVGALYVSSQQTLASLAPLIVGGGQERGLRAGTLNVPGIVGFGEACRIVSEEISMESIRVSALRDRLERAIKESLPDVFINGDIRNRLPNTSNITFIGVDARALIRDVNDIALSTKSACSSGTPGPSHVLKAIGLSDDEAYSTVRFSLGRFTTEREIDYTSEKLIVSVRKLRSLGNC